jgi:hypothetical protein
MERMINETRLLWKADGVLSDPSPDGLAALVADRGIDFATAALYAVVRRRHRAFVEAVDAFVPTEPLPRLPGELWVVPAAGYRERPEYGGDGGLLREIAEDFGLRTRTLDLRSLGPVPENARVLREALASATPRSVVLATLSKGAAELKVALRDPGPHHEALRGWLNIGGLPLGTPLLDVGPSHPKLWLMLRVMTAIRRIERGFLDGLRYRSPLLTGPVDVPPGVPVISVVGFPLRAHLEGTLAERHALLAPLGPNDGYGLCLDAMAHGHVYPVWGASHYLRTPGLSRTFYGILSWLSEVPCSRS